MTDDRSGVDIGLGEGFIHLTPDEGAALAHLYQTPGWQVLRTILAELVNGTTVALRDRSKNLEDLRFCQGQADAAGRIADIVEDEIPQWYNEGSVQPKETAEGGEEDDA